MLDTFDSRAFAVCDHQLAHVYVPQPDDRAATRDLLAEPAGRRPRSGRRERRELGLDHPRSGELVALSEPDAWFAYPFWLDDRLAPDFARTVDIHRKPGYDPCELFFDPHCSGRRAGPCAACCRRSSASAPCSTSCRSIRGWSAAVMVSRRRLTEDKPILIADGPKPDHGHTLPMTEINPCCSAPSYRTDQAKHEPRLIELGPMRTYQSVLRPGFVFGSQRLQFQALADGYSWLLSIPIWLCFANFAGSSPDRSGEVVALCLTEDLPAGEARCYPRRISNLPVPADSSRNGMRGGGM